MGLSLTALILSAAPSPASAMRNGTEIRSAPPWAAYLTTVSKFLFFQTTESSCTATIIAARWVLSAAHCVVKDDTSGQPTSTQLKASKFRIVVGRSDLSKPWQGHQLSVDRVSIDPDWHPSTLAGDAALLHLAKELPKGALPLALAPSSWTPGDGQALLAYGYGCTSTSYDQKALAAGSYSKYSCAQSKRLRRTKTASYRSQSACATQSDLCLAQLGASEIQNGDSGGPWVPDDTLKPYIVAITSFLSDPTQTSASTVHWQRVGASRITAASMWSWIQSTADIGAGKAGVIYRDQSSGASFIFRKDGFLHSIPTGGAYRCLKAAGAHTIDESSFDLAELPISTGQATCTPHSERTYFYNKRQGWLVRPRTLDFCSTGCEYDGLSWRGWDTRIATGKGFFAPKTSDPRVNGRWPVVIKLSRRRRCPNHRLIYTRYEETLTGKLPPWDPPRVTRINWGCDGTHNGQY